MNSSEDKQDALAIIHSIITQGASTGSEVTRQISTEFNRSVRENGIAEAESDSIYRITSALTVAAKYSEAKKALNAAELTGNLDSYVASITGEYLDDDLRKQLKRTGSRNGVKWLSALTIIFSIAGTGFFAIRQGSGTVGFKTPLSSSPVKSEKGVVDQLSMPRCGDDNLDGQQLWYPVFIEEGDTKKLEYVRQKYCQDAILKVNNAVSQSIQVASFLKKEDAEKFTQSLLKDEALGKVSVGSISSK